MDRNGQTSISNACGHRGSGFVAKGCVARTRHRDYSEEAFIEQFVDAGVGNKEQAASIAHMLGISKGQMRLMSNRPSLEQVDSLLSLTG